METFITIIHISTAVFMILVVLVQGGSSGGVGAAFGGGNSQGVFGATGATSLLGKLTYGAAAVFMMTSIWLSVLQGRSGKTGLRQKLEQSSTTVPSSSSDKSDTRDTKGVLSSDSPQPIASASPSAG